MNDGDSGRDVDAASAPEGLFASRSVRDEVRSSADGWSLVFRGFDPDAEGLREALCTVGNGHFCSRGAAPEARADDVHYPGTYRAGCYDRLATTLAGETVENESLVNLPNWLPMAFRVEDGPWIGPDRLDLLEYRQELDFRRGLLLRRFRVRDGEGRITGVRERRFVSMDRSRRTGLETTVTAENWSGRLHVRAGLDARVENAGVDRYRELEGRHLVPAGTDVPGRDSMVLRARTVQSRIDVAEAARLRLWRDGEEVAPEREEVREPGYVAHRLSVDVGKGQSVAAEKMVTLSTSRDPAISEAAEEARRELERTEGFGSELERHRRAWAHLWRRFEIGTDLPGREERWTNCVLRLHVFHLLQTVSEHTAELDAGVPARGWHGEAYRGTSSGTSSSSSRS